jgi:hypothetical protein
MTNKVGHIFFPGSDKPFNPINPHGAKARYPSGWKNPLAEKLYQVHVEDRELGHIRIGPKVGQAIADELCAATRLAIAAGQITGWSNPHVLPAPPEQVRWTGPTGALNTSLAALSGVR